MNNKKIQSQMQINVSFIGDATKMLKTLEKNVSLSSYHQLLFERKELVESVKDLNEKHSELKKLLTNYMNSDINRELIVPPHKSIMKPDSVNVEYNNVI